MPHDDTSVHLLFLSTCSLPSGVPLLSAACRGAWSYTDGSARLRGALRPIACAYRTSAASECKSAYADKRKTSCCLCSDGFLVIRSATASPSFLGAALHRTLPQRRFATTIARRHGSLAAFPLYPTCRPSPDMRLRFWSLRPQRRCVPITEGKPTILLLP